MKQLFSIMLAISLTLGLTFGTHGETPTQPFAFKNLTIDTIGNQTYDRNQNIISSTSHVRITIDDTVIEADSLTFYEDKNQLVATGNVRMVKNTVSLNANQMIYYTDTGWLEASGKAYFRSPFESYQSESIRYNLNQKIGTMGPLEGVRIGSPKNFYLTGKDAQLSDGTIIISSAALTRSPWKGNPDYVFEAQRMIIQGEDIVMEKVVFKMFGAPVLYLPRMVLQGEAAPRINLSASQGEETDLSQMVEKIEGNQKVTRSFEKAPEKASEKVEINPRFQVLINPMDKPSQITVGRIYSWDHYSNEMDLNFDSRGIFSFSDIYQIDWVNYNLMVDGKTDLVEKPQQELGMAFTKKAWRSNYGNWQVGLVTRWLYNNHGSETDHGIYGGYRLDYQLNPDLNLSYLYLCDLSGSKPVWERLERDFLIINNYRLGGNLIYSLNVPLSPHYFIINRGYYSLEKDSWTSQILLLAREVGYIKAGIGWDFAKNFVELTFKLNY